MKNVSEYVLICQKWEESERGWGTRPDGYSLHVTDADRKAFIKEYWDGMPDTVPHEYGRPCGTPYACPVHKRLWEYVKRDRNGRRFSGSAPYPGGSDGWYGENPPMLTDEKNVKGMIRTDEEDASLKKVWEELVKKYLPEME